MTLGAPSFLDRDLAVGWIDSAQVVHIPSQSNPDNDVAWQGGGFQARSYRADTTGMAQVGDDDLSFGFWFKIDTWTEDQAIMMAQNQATNRAWTVFMSNGGRVYTSARGSLTTGAGISSKTNVELDDNVWHRYFSVIENDVGTEDASVRIAIDGIETGYEFLDSKFLTGFDGFVANVDLSMGNEAGGGGPVSFWDGAISDPSLWRNTAEASFAAAAAEDYATEIALIGGGEFTPQQINRASYILGSSPRIEA